MTTCMLKEAENKNKSVYSRIRPFELLLNPWTSKRKIDEPKYLSMERLELFEENLDYQSVDFSYFSTNFSISTGVPSLNCSTRSNALLIRIRGA